MKVLLFITLAVTVLSSAQAAKEIKGFTFLGTVSNSGGIGVQSLSNLYLNKAMSTQIAAETSCESIGPNSYLLSIIDAQKDDQVRSLLLRAGTPLVWMSGFMHNGVWKWGGQYLGVPFIGNYQNWLGGTAAPSPLPNYGVLYSAANKLDVGWTVLPVNQMRPFLCETPAD